MVGTVVVHTRSRPSPAERRNAPGGAPGQRDAERGLAADQRIETLAKLRFTALRPCP